MNHGDLAIKWYIYFFVWHWISKNWWRWTSQTFSRWEGIPVRRSILRWSVGVHSATCQWFEPLGGLWVPLGGLQAVETHMGNEETMWIFTKIGDMLCVIYISSGGLPMNAWWKLEFFWGKDGFNKRRDFIEIALVHLQSHRSIHSARLSFEVTELRNNQFLFSVICSCCGLTSGIASAQTPPPLFSVICICMYVGYLHIHTWTRIYIYMHMISYMCIYKYEHPWIHE